jgi:hypothetical protein
VTINVYKSSDASAPVLNNVAGSLIAVLDACLVSGYGAKAAAGWTKPFFLSTTGAVYRQGTGSNGFYLNIDDTQPNCARARGFEVATAYNTGTGLFPTDALQAGGAYFHKTNNVAGSQTWVVVATTKMLYFFTSYDANPTHVNGSWFLFGDFLTEKPGDTFNTLLMGATGVSQTTTASNAPSTTAAPYYSFVSHTLPGHWLPRTYTGLGSCVAASKHINFSRLGYSTNGTWLNSYAYTNGNSDLNSGLIYPSPASGGMYLSPIWAHEPLVVRGRLPGIYVLQTFSTKPAQLDTYTGTGDMVGKTFICVNIWGSQFHIETSDTW